MIANCRKGPLSANHDRKKYSAISEEQLYNFSWSRTAEKGHFLQITIVRKTLQFLNKNYKISRDRELQKRATFCKSRLQEKLYNFSRISRDCKLQKRATFCKSRSQKILTISQEIYTISRDRELQKRTSFRKSWSQEILYNFSRNLYSFSWSQIAENDQFLQIMIARNTLKFLKNNYTISHDHEFQKRATFCKSRSQEEPYNFSRKTIQFLVIGNCRKGPPSANHDRKKNFTISQEKLYNFSWSRIAEKGHFLQITIARILYNFLRTTIQFLMIANSRKKPLSANQDHKKNFTISRDWELQKRATFCKSRSQEELYNFSRKTIQFLVITNGRKGPLSANHDRKKYSTIS